MSTASIPLAVVGLTFREAPTEWRAAVAALDSSANGPAAELRARGFATGVVRLETCSRSEWFISAEQPKWAAELLQSGLLARLPNARRHNFHLRSGLAAAHYMFRVAAGLDSLVEGEGAVCRQVLKAFSQAHELGATDRTLNIAWNQVGKLAHTKRQLGLQRQGWGVQQIVLAELKQRQALVSAPVLIFGGGQIGGAIADLLRRSGYTNLQTFRRATLGEFRRATTTAAVVIMASGAPEAWCDLPARADGAIAIDVGSPPQIRQRGGFTVVDLDTLLARPGCQLSDNDVERLHALVEAHVIEFSQRLQTPEGRTLRALTARHASFMHEVLPRLLASIEQPELARELRREIQGFTHALVQQTLARPLGGAKTGGDE